MILFFLLSLIISLIALFGLPYYLFSRYNKAEGVVSAVISIITALILLIVISMLFPYLPPIIYAKRLLVGVTETVSIK